MKRRARSGAFATLWTLLILGAFAAGPGLATQAAEVGASSGLDDYLAYATEHNAELQAALRQWRAAVALADRAGALPDPRVSYTYYVDEVETRVGPQEQKFGASQAVPWPGKLGLRGESASAEAQAARERYETLKNRVALDVKRAYYDYYYLGRSLAVTAENVELLKQIENVAQARYRAGAPLAGVIKAQVELGKLEDRLRTLRDLERPTAARLNAAMNRPVDAPLEVPASLPENAVAVDEDAVRAALASSPQLREMDQLVVRADKNVALARREYVPDLTLGVEYIDTGEALMPNVPDSGKDPLMVMASVNVPLWIGRNRAAVREAVEREAAARSAREGRSNMLSADLEAALYGYRDAERKIGLYRDTLVPQAEQALGVAREAYEAGSVPLLDVVDAQRVYLEFELALERAQVDRLTRLAEIEAIVGQPLPAEGRP